MMGGHKDRKHALLSASAAHRWLYCTPSARLEEQFPDKPSEAAAEGTLAHELAEAKVRNYFYPADFSKRKLTSFVKKMKENELWQDEMVEHTDAYLDYIKGTALALDSQPYVAIEREVDYGGYAPEGFGTADCIIVGDGCLHIIDFKYGKSPDGRVTAEGNPQLSLYALGAYEAYKILYPIERVKLAIVQPRLPDGISEWECTLKELLMFGEFVRKRAALASKGEGDFNPHAETCRYCRARAQCRARSDRNVKQAFDLGELPPLITAEEAGRRLCAMEDVAKYQKDLQAWALSECLAGKDVPGWKAVEGRGSRDWADMDKAFKTLTDGGINEAILWEKKPLTLAQVEKVVGKKDFEAAVGSMVVWNPGKPALVKESDKRPAITNKVTAVDAFKEEK